MGYAGECAARAPPGRHGRAADDRAAELERATETLGTSSGSGDIAAYVEAQARARVAGKIEDDAREWLLEAARALLP